MRRCVLVLACFVIVLALAFYFSPFVHIAQAMELAKSLLGLSALLFGVLGMWISIVYRDEIVTGIWNKDIKAQKKAAELLLVAHDRCAILFRAFWLSAIVVVVLYGIIIASCQLFQAFYPMITARPVLMRSLRFGLSFVLFACGFVQIYVLLSCLSPMYYIMRELSEARKSAERIIALSGNADGK